MRTGSDTNATVAMLRRATLHRTSGPNGWLEDFLRDETGSRIVKLDLRWNMNVHYHRAVLDALPVDARTALDVGCGDGLLSFDIAARGLQVTGVDIDRASIDRASVDERATAATRFLVGDFLTIPLRAGAFDVVASVSTLHHMDAQAGIRRMRELVSPGGVIAIVGFATSSGNGDRVRAIAGGVMKRWMQWRGHYWEHNAPTVWPPPLSTNEMADLVERELPGATFRRVLSNRYTATWTKPGGPAGSSLPGQ